MHIALIYVRKIYIAMNMFGLIIKWSEQERKEKSVRRSEVADK